jgi:isoleucyl-tRNA synthetase
MIVREVAEGLAVEADENYTAALDLKLTPELRQSCMARELVNRIQNRRKEMDLQITDRVRIYLSGLGGYADLRSAVERHRDYILEETQGVGISFESEEGVAGNALTAVVVEGCEIGVGLVPLL